MPLSDETLEAIADTVRGGFEDRDSILEIFLEERYEPGELDAAEVEKAVDAAIAAHEASKATWSEVTDCDRLDQAFAALERRNVIALQNAGYTQSDGYSDFCEALDDSPDPSKIIGYCFFHEQDLERAVSGEGLMLAFGPTSPEDEEVEGPKVGRIIVEELERAGLRTEWDGTFAQRINVPKIVWQRR